MFSRSLPGWTTAVALIDDHDLKTGAIYDPAEGNLWSSDRAFGTTMNGAAVSVSSCRDLGKAIVHMAFPVLRQSDATELRLASGIAANAGAGMALGAPSISLARVASGQIDAWVNIDMKPWDWQPGRCLVEGAGGHTAEVRHWKIAAATTELLEKLIDLLARS